MSAGDASEVIAVVNGTEITVSQVSSGLSRDAGEDFSSMTLERKSQLVMSLINRQLVLEQARKEAFDASPEIQDAVQQSNNRVAS